MKTQEATYRMVLRGLSHMNEEQQIVAQGARLAADPSRRQLLLPVVRAALRELQHRIHDMYQNSPTQQAARLCRSRSGAGRERGPVRS